MSTTSTVTASVICDPTLGNVHNLVNCICTLVATQGNGTLFSPNSFQEEDLVELCVSLGQAHPDGVFQILETKALLAFCSTTEMMATMHLLGAAMAWCNKPIGLHTHPPTNTDLRTYVAVRGAHLSSAQTLTSGREVVSQSPLATLTLRRGPCLLSRWPLGTWGFPVKTINGRPLAGGSTQRVDHIPHWPTLGSLEGCCQWCGCLFGR